MLVFQDVNLLLLFSQISFSLLEDAVLLLNFDVEFISLLFLHDLVCLDIPIHLLVLLLPRLIILALLFNQLFIRTVLQIQLLNLLQKVLNLLFLLIDLS